ncbi:MAG: TRAP transporter small permease [Alphaproteobacteria bacterium]
MAEKAKEAPAEAGSIAVARRLAAWLALAGGGLILTAVAIVVVDVLGRRFFAWSVGGADEISGYAFAAATTFAFAHVYLERANIRIDILYDRFPTPVRLLADLVGALALLILSLCLLRFGYDVFAQSLRLGSVSNSAVAIPLALPQAAWLFGLAFFVLVQTVVLLHVVRGLIRRDRGSAADLLGTRPIEAEEALAVPGRAPAP